MKACFSLLVVTVVALLASSVIGATYPTCPGQGDHLSAFFNSTGGPNWTNKDNWLVGDPCTNNWYGLSCTTNSALKCREVYSIDLSSNNLVGSIGDSLDQLPLLGVSLRNNKLTGSVPSAWFQSNSQLTFLNVASNLLTSIPADLSAAPRLSTVYLSNNQFSGPLPKLPKYIRTLDVSGNQFTGGFPAQANFDTLVLSGNRLSGTIPSWVSGITFYNFNISHNSFTGAFPAIKVDYSLDVSYNQFTSLIFSVNSYPSKIDISGNNFGGSLTLPLYDDLYSFKGANCGFTSCSVPGPLRQLDLSGNRLSGASLTNCLKSLTMVESINLNYNPLGPTFSLNIPQVPVTQLSLRSTGISNCFSSIFIGNLTTLDLSYNHFKNPQDLINCVSASRNVRFLDASFNAISGDIPFFPTLSTLQHLNLDWNSITGIANGINPRLNSLSIAHNKLTDNFFPALTNSISQIFSIEASGNAFTVFPNLSQFSLIQYIGLANSTISGLLPSYLGSLPHLEYLNLSNNFLTGPVPQELGKCHFLAFLYLQNNKLTGALPPFLQTTPLIWKKIKSGSYNLSGNQFQCPLPQWCAQNNMCTPCVA